MSRIDSTPLDEWINFESLDAHIMSKGLFASMGFNPAGIINV
jgi:hypothetical protein